MAITNAQQYKQLLAKGGRIGLKPGGPPGGGATSMGSGRDYSGPSGPAGGASGGGNYGGNKNPEQEFGGSIFSGGGDGPSGPSTITPKSKPPITKDNFKKSNKFVTPAMAVLSFLSNKISGSKPVMLNKKLQINNYLATLTPEEQVEALEDLSKIGIGTDSPMGIDRNITRGMGDRGLFGTGIGGGEFITDIDVGGPEAKAVLGDGYTNYQEEQRNRFTSDEGGDGIQDPCKGPNPPAYCFTGLRSAEAATPEIEEEDEIINYRLMADGGKADDGRIGFFKGAQADASAGKGAMSPGTDTGGGFRGGEGDGPSGPPTDVGGGGITNLTSKKDIPTLNTDFSKFDVKDLINLGLVDPEDENTKLAGLNKKQVEYLDKVGKKVQKVDNTATDLFTYDSPTDIKTQIEKLNPKSETIFGNFDPDKIVEGDSKTYATDQDIEKYMKDTFKLTTGDRKIGLADGGMPYEGGIMDLETSRQMYGLGKLVKKITRGVKKIAKSPIGKAALLYAGGSYLSGMGAFGGLKGAGAFNSQALGLKKFLMGSALPPSQGLGKSKGLLDFIGGKAGAGILGTTALSYFMTPEEEEQKKLASYGADIDDPSYIMNNPSLYTNRRLAAEGGSMDEPVAKKTMPLLDMDGQEMDLREEGGFVPLGRMERADDVPARLSKNEFVFTADAVRNAGEGDVDKGAEVMYNMMKNLESGGDVSEESQGLEGAREMFQTSQRLEEVI